MLFALAAMASTSIALTTELAFTCAGKKGVFVRPGPVGLGVRRAYRELDRCLPLLSAIAAASSIGLALAAGLRTRGAWMGLAAALAICVHYTIYARMGRRMQKDATCLDLAKVSPAQLAELQSRWETAMTTRASLLAAALVCLVASVILG